MSSDMVEMLRVKYQFKELENGARPLLEIETLTLSEFCIHEDLMISAVIKLSEKWNLSIINIGLCELPFDEGLENNWEIGFLYEGMLFQTMWLLAPIFTDTITSWNPYENVITGLSLDDINKLLPVLKEKLGRFDK
jgi:hypothetical protein